MPIDQGGHSRKIDMLMKLIDMFHAASTADQGGGGGGTPPMMPGGAAPQIPPGLANMGDMQRPGMSAPMAPGAIDPRDNERKKMMLLQMLMGQRR